MASPGTTPGASPGPNNPSSPILSVPDNIQELRDQLFNLAVDAQITMPTDEFHAVWPFLDNMYVSNSQLLSKKSGARTTYYYCRLWQTKRWISRVTEESRKRARTSRPLVSCPCKLKAVTRGDVVTIMRNGKEGHNHGYDALEFKIPSGVRRLAAQEVAKGHWPSEVTKKLKDPQNGNPEALQRAGGANIRTQDIANANQCMSRARLDSSSRNRDSLASGGLVRFTTTTSSDSPTGNIESEPESPQSQPQSPLQQDSTEQPQPQSQSQSQPHSPPQEEPTEQPSQSSSPPEPSEQPRLQQNLLPPHTPKPQPTIPPQLYPLPTNIPPNFYITPSPRPEAIFLPPSSMRGRIHIQLPPPFSQIPRHPILYPDPSPIHALPTLSHLSTTSQPPSTPSPPHICIFAKREDQGSPLASTGNKYRKLEYIVPDILCQTPSYHYHESHPGQQPLAGPATILVTEGALQSNHTVQVAALARNLGLKALVLLNRDTGGGYKASSAPETFARLGNVQNNKLLGAEIRIYNAEDPESRDAQPVIDELREAGHRPYWIPGGASLHPLGGLGYARAAFEIVVQETELQLGGSGRFDYIFVACGSGSTVAGLIAGFKLLKQFRLNSGPGSGKGYKGPKQPKRNIIGILNSPTNPREYHEKRVLRFARQAGTQIGLWDAERKINKADVRLDDRFVGEGYGVVDDETRKAMSMMAEAEGILLDPVYTAKVAGGMINVVQSEEITEFAQTYGLQEVNVLFIHTGGQAALSAYYDQLG